MRIFAHFAFLVYGLSGPFLLVLRPLHCRSSSVTTVETAVCLKMMTLSCMVASGSPLWLRVANVSPLWFILMSALPLIRSLLSKHSCGWQSRYADFLPAGCRCLRRLSTCLSVCLFATLPYSPLFVLAVGLWSEADRLEALIIDTCTRVTMWPILSLLCVLLCCWLNI